MAEKKELSAFQKYYTKPENREKHLDYMKEKVKCTCGNEVARSYMTIHKRTKSHTKNLQKKSNIKFFSEYISKNELSKH